MATRRIRVRKISKAGREAISKAQIKRWRLWRAAKRVAAKRKSTSSKRKGRGY